jgi:hypothetical protein
MVYKRWPAIPKTIGDYEYVGCYQDKAERAIPTIGGIVKTADECRAKAEANFDNIFGL